MNILLTPGCRVMELPPTRAMSISPDSMAWHAWTSATRAELQAVSMFMEGPWKS